MIDHMDMRDAIISITGIQRDSSDQQEAVELVTAGKYGFANGESRFTYEESGLTGLEGTRTTFTISPMGVVLKREGNLNSQMVFREGESPALPENLRVLHDSSVGRVRTLIVRESAQDAEEKLRPCDPLFMEALPLSLEEIFIYELGGADYAVKEIIL